MKKTAVAYLFVTLFCVLFGAVYERFSHEVYSYYMLYAFGFPLAGGVLPFVCLAFYGKALPGRLACRLYHSGIAALTVGSLFQGALDIYGTTNRLILVYWIAGGVLLFLGMAVYFVEKGKKARYERGRGYGHARGRAGMRREWLGRDGSAWR